VISLSALAAFVVVSVVLIALPGPDTALVVRNTFVGGRRGGFVTAGGIVGGLALWTLAASIGVTALLVASQTAFQALKLVGAAYLLYLGLRTLWAVWRRGPAELPAGRAARLPDAVALRQGALCNLSNPKIAVFFATFLPQFAGDSPSFPALLTLGLVYLALTVAWFAGYVWIVARLGDLLRRPSVRRGVESITGLTLVAFGIGLAADRS
jgi:threonine/homoserine/homoserine lactone efflux protein